MRKIEGSLKWGFGLVVLVSAFFVARPFFIDSVEGRTDRATEDWMANIREFPVAISPLVDRPPLLCTPRIDWLTSGMDVVPVGDSNVLSPSTCIHLVKCFGHDVKVSISLDSGTRIVRALDLILDEELSLEIFGYKSYVKTRTGIRFPTMTKAGLGTNADEAHRDQCLASLAEFGLPTTQQLSVRGESYSLKDVLLDSVANFHIDQEELEWTLVAYALLLPGSEGWVNRFGERFSFDQAAVELMRRSIEDASCGGTHRFFTLNVMQRVDDEVVIFSSDVRAKVGEFIRRAVECAVSNQQTDGAWSPGWNRALFTDASAQTKNDRPSSNREKIIMTGHLAEWMLYLPGEMQVDPIVMRKLSIWLSAQLQEVTEEEWWGDFCPYTHAYCSLTKS